MLKWLLIAVFSARAAVSGAQDNLCPSPNPMAPANLVEPGEYLTPPHNSTTEIRVVAGEQAATLVFSKHRVEILWDDAPPVEPLLPWPDERYWWLTNEAGMVSQYGTYCRFDCTNRNTEADQDSDWLCRTNCITVRASDYLWQLLTSTDCGETWSVAWTQTIVPEGRAAARRATRRLRP